MLDFKRVLFSSYLFGKTVLCADHTAYHPGDLVKDGTASEVVDQCRQEPFGEFCDKFHPEHPLGGLALSDYVEDV